MIKKLVWMVMLVLATACSVLLSEGGDLNWFDPVPTQAGVFTEIPVITVEFTPDATAEFTATAVLPTSTTAPTETLLPTGTVLPTSTGTALPTATTVLPTVTPSKTPTPVFTPTATALPFKIQAATPVFMANFAHLEAGCAWQGVAGQVFDKAGNPLTNYVVKITGFYNGSKVDLVGITGMVAGTPYGPASYELVLGTKAIDSIDKLSIQLFSNRGVAITDLTPFSTSSSCSKNLVVINFIEK